MKIAISGMGKRSNAVLHNFKAAMPEIEFVGYFDPQPSYLEQLDAAIPAYDNVPDMLSQTKPDLFFIGSPNEFHLSDMKAGFRAGIKMFVEKPVVTTLEDTFELLALLKEYGADQAIIGLVLRYSRHMVDLRKAISYGMLGPIASIEASEHITPDHGAFFMRDWRRKTARSGGFMLEKCCHDLDLYNMITGSRPKYVASFGAKRSFIPQNRPADESDMALYHSWSSVWDSTDDPFASDSDIIDCQTALLEYESGASMAFHTNLNVPDEQRRFCVIGSKAMAEGDFCRGYLTLTEAKSKSTIAHHDYTELGEFKGHYGADEMMAQDIIQHLKDPNFSLPVSIIDALEAGVAALAIDMARTSKTMFDLTPIWERFDAYGVTS